MDAYQYRGRLSLEVVKDGAKQTIEFAEAEIQVKTWRSAPYGYGRDELVPETMSAYIDLSNGVLTVDPEAYVGGEIISRDWL